MSDKESHHSEHKEHKEHENKEQGHKDHGSHGLNMREMQKHVFAGAMAGLCEVLIMYPLDVVKTRLQLSTTGASQSVLSSFAEVIKNEGFANLYRGIIAPILAEAPKRALKFTSNEVYKSLLADIRPNRKLADIDYVISGAAAGCTEALINCPFELVKVRMQAKENLGVYKSTFHAAQVIASKEGAISLWIGLESMFWRNGIWNAAYFGCINKVKQTLPAPNPNDHWAVFTQKFAAGFIAGTLATILNNPFDVVKSRVQNTLPHQTRVYSWTIPGLARIASNEGLAALYKGFVPKVLRLGPGGGVMLVAFDYFSALADRYHIFG